MASPPNNHNSPDAFASIPVDAPVAFSNAAVSVKLDEKNFLIWLQQTEAVIRGHRLQRFVDSREIPRRFLSEDDRDAGRVNEEYLRWEQQDQLLLAWLLSTLSEPILTRVVGCLSSWEAWEELQFFFHKQALGKVSQFRSELLHIKKGAESIFEYLLRIKALVDSLRFAGFPVSSQQHVDHILDGLPAEYDGFVTFINTHNRLQPYTVREIESMLFAHEARIEKKKQQNLSDVSSSRTESDPLSDCSCLAPPHAPNPNSSNEVEFDQHMQPAQEQSHAFRSSGGRGGGGRFGGRGGQYRRGGRPSQVFHGPMCDNGTSMPFAPPPTRFAPPVPQPAGFSAPMGPPPIPHSSLPLPPPPPHFPSCSFLERHHPPPFNCLPFASAPVYYGPH